ncbi:hypothetical protein ACLPHM_15400 [Paenalcaligenes sp. Me131]|uniref:hypothetical protein n=1 Tax=Paenalcaligenes sp. Me131 TaxID=3392636 RepID=UPI003D2A0D5D
MKPASSLLHLRQRIDQRLQPLLSGLQQQWQRQTPRERLRVRVLLWCLPFLVLGYVAFQLWQLSQQHSQQLRVAHYEFTQLQTLLGQPTPTAIPTAQYSPTEVYEALQNSLQPFKNDQATLVSLPDHTNSWQLRLQQVPAEEALVWLLHTPASLNLHITATKLSRSRIEGREQAGVLSGTVTVQYQIPATEGVSQS